MKTKKILGYIGIFLVIVSVAIFIVRIQSHAGEGGTKDGITLAEAVEIAQLSANEWSKEAKLYRLTSADDSNDLNPQYGSNGRRKNWNVEFDKPGTQKHFMVNIQNGKVSDSHVSIGPNQIINYVPGSDLDSPTAVKLASKLYHLRPGRGFSVGYNYQLNQVNNIATLTVFGRDQQGHMATVDFNAKNSKPINAVREVPVGGGLMIDGSEKKAFQKKTITGLFFNNPSSNIVVWGQVNPSTDNATPFVSISKDDGSNWSKVQYPENAETFGFSSNGVLYTATDNAILRYNASQFKWVSVYRCKNGFQNFIFSDRNGWMLKNDGTISRFNYRTNQVTHPLLPTSTPIVYMSVSSDGYISLIDKKREVYISGNGYMWEKVRNKLNNQLIGVYNWQQRVLEYSSDTASVMNKHGKWTSLKIPFQLSSVQYSVSNVYFISPYSEVLKINLINSSAKIKQFNTKKGAVSFISENLAGHWFVGFVPNLKSIPMKRGS